MKKSILLLAGFILLMFTACQNDELVNGGGGNQVAASFNVQLPGDNSPATRAEAGDGTTVNRCIMEIYLGGKLYGERQVVAVTDKIATFNVKLVTSQTYDFVFWADVHGGSDITVDNHYKTTEGLEKIAFFGTYDGNDETRDAFSATLKQEVTGAFSANVNMTRPFGQLNIQTTDLAEIKSEDFKPTTASLTFQNVYTGFDALTGDVSGETEISYSANAAVVDAATGKLTVDYLFAPKDNQQLLANMVLTMNKDDKKITDKALNNIPIQRNYKTNVSGNMLTASGKVTTTLVPQFAETINEEIIEVDDITEVGKALESYDNVVIATALTEDATISLPKYTATDKSVSITLPDTKEKTVTIKYDETTTGGNTNAPKELTITAPTSTKLVIDATSTTVYLNGKLYSEIEGGTAANTLVINDGVTVQKLTVKAGNVKVFGNGKIGEIARSAENVSATTYIYASGKATITTITGDNIKKLSLEAQSIKEAMNAGGTYQLTENADITGSSVTVSSDKTATLDLNGYTIKAANKTGDNIAVYGNLVLKDSKGKGKIVASRDSPAGYNGGLICVIGENASMTMQSGTIYAVRSTPVTNGQYGVMVEKGGDFTMTGGKIEAGWYAVTGNGGYDTQNSIVNIKGGELISTADYAVYLPQSGTTTISGGTVYGAAGGVCIQRGTLNVEGTAFITSKGTGDTGNWGDGTGGLDCAAINVNAKYGASVVNIKGGTLTAEAKALISEGTTYSSTINVSGGTFSDPTLLGHLSAGANVKVKLLKDYEGPGLGIFYSKNGSRATVDIDLNNHTWNLTEDPLFGSTGTVSQYFHLEKEAFVTFKNGTIQPKKATSAKMLIQNYCHLTLNNVKLIGGTSCDYVVSNNNGSCTITNSTITAAAGKVAFDVYSYTGYTGVTVTVNSGSTITGKVEFGGDSGKKSGRLVINGGHINGNLTVDNSYYDSTNKNIIISSNAIFASGVTGWDAYK